VNREWEGERVSKFNNHPSIALGAVSSTPRRSLEREGRRREGGEGGREERLGGQDRKDSAAGLGPEERSSSSQHLSTN